MRVGVIGSGISGLTTAAVFQRDGHEVVVFERGARVGGVWAQTYPEVRLQNIQGQYELSGVPWTTPSDLNPTGDQIRAYLDSVVERVRPNVRLQHTVTEMTEEPKGWVVSGESPEGPFSERFDHVVLAVGQFTQPKDELKWEGRETFAGELLTERDLMSLDKLKGRRVAVVGFGKTALDLCTLAADRGAQVTQVFRTPRWMIPHRFLDLIHFSYILFSRFGSVMVPCWAQPNAIERILHRATGPIRGFWWGVERVFLRQIVNAAKGRGPEAAARLNTITPTHSLLSDMRSAAPMTPHGYLHHVAEGHITPRQGAVARFTPSGLGLQDGGEVQAELVVLALGSGSPVFPYLPQKYRALIEGGGDGVQLYRHLIHPRIPNLSFSGYNHSFLHFPCAELGAWWVCALLRGELILPSPEQQEQEMAQVAAWKRAQINHESSLLCGVNTRFQQYMDILLGDLGVSPYRKLPNPLAEVFGRYTPADYRAVPDEILAARARGVYPKAVLPVAT